VRKAARIDGTAKALRAYAESVGFTVVVVNDVIDCLLCYGQLVFIVDWKSKGGTLTDAQTKLVAKGAPIRFITTPAQVDALRTEADRWLRP
jgi:hypothetical protein